LWWVVVDGGGHPPHKRAGAGNRVQNNDRTQDVRPKVHYVPSLLHLGFVLSGTGEKLSSKGLCLFHNSRTNIWHRPQQLPGWFAVIVSHSVARSSPLVWWVTTTTHHNQRHQFALILSIQTVARPKNKDKIGCMPNPTYSIPAKQNLPLPAV
jgi:hypothetical protein